MLALLNYVYFNNNAYFLVYLQFSYSNDSQSNLDSSSSGYIDSSLPSTIEREYSFQGMQVSIPMFNSIS